MIIHYLTQLGLWNWFLASLLLLILEIIMPGIFFMWFGLAALMTGTLAFLFAASLGFGWQAQVITFLILSVAIVVIGRRFLGAQKSPGDPLINQRGEQLIGMRATLDETIVNGRGRIRINDTLWRVTGPDLAAGTRVRVVAFNPISLEVEVEADEQPAHDQQS